MGTLDFSICENIMFSQLLFGATILSFLVFLIYIYRFLKITYHKNIMLNDEHYEPITIIVVVVDELEYLKTSFNTLLHQDYPTDYQVVVVNDRPETSEIVDYLDSLKDKYKNKLYVTTIKKDGHLTHTKRLGYTIGMKAAKYNNVIFSDPKVAVTSKIWLKSMGRGFANDTEVVLSYVDIKYNRKFSNKIFRTVNAYDSMMWLIMAHKKNAFRASILNLGISSKLFFKIGGYRERLRLNSGESDIFVQKLTKGANNTRLILAPSATVAKNYDDYSFIRWYKNQTFDQYTTRFYKFKDFMHLTIEPLFTLIFWTSAFSFIIFNYTLWYYILAMIVIRWGLIYYTLFRFSKLTGSKIPYFTSLLYDIFGPYYKFILFLSRKFNPSCDLWIRIAR